MPPPINPNFPLNPSKHSTTSQPFSQMLDPSRPVTGYPAPNYTYPYPAPPPPQRPPPQRRTFFRTLIAVGAFVVIIFGVALLIFWLVMNPHLPSFHLTSLSVSNLSTSQNQVTGNWDARFQVYNPSNKMSLYFDNVVSKLFFKSEFVSQTNIPPFYQDKKNLTTLAARFSVLGSYLDGRAINSINTQKTRGQVMFNLKVDSLIAFKYGAYRTRRRYLRVWCNDVAVNVTGNSGGSGKLVGGVRKCKHY